jgi:hypothetical protein
MKWMTRLIVRHLAGDAEPARALPTVGGTIHLERTNELLSAYGGLVAYSAFVKKLGWLDDLAARFPRERTSPNALPVADVLRGCELNRLGEGRRFAHVRAVQNAPAVAQVMGMKRVPGEDAFPRLVKSLPRDKARPWLAGTERELYAALPKEFVADWDAPVNVRDGHQEDAEAGYNPFQPGRRSHHPLICIAAGTRLCLRKRWRPGDAVRAAGWVETLHTLWAHPTNRERHKLNRGDKAFGQEANLAWHEREEVPRPQYVFGLRLPKNVRRALAQVPWPLWEGQPPGGLELVAETTVKLQGWRRARRVVLVRTTKPVNAGPADEFWALPEEEVQAFVTNLPVEEATVEQVVRLGRKRGDAENVYDELKNQRGNRGYCRRRGVVPERAARLLLLPYNLWRKYVSLLLGQSQREANTPRSEFLMLAGQLPRSGRQQKLKLAVSAGWWQRLRAGYERLSEWLKLTAPQLDLQGDLSRYWSPHPLFSPSDWFKKLAPNCGI